MSRAVWRRRLTSCRHSCYDLFRIYSDRSFEPKQLVIEKGIIWYVVNHHEYGKTGVILDNKCISVVALIPIMRFEINEFRIDQSMEGTCSDIVIPLNFDRLFLRSTRPSLYAKAQLLNNGNNYIQGNLIHSYSDRMNVQKMKLLYCEKN